MREVLNARDKREAIKRYIASNPELSNRKIAKYWDVHNETIRRYRRVLGMRASLGAAIAAENGQKVPQLRHSETDNLPVVMNANGESFDAEKIKLGILQTMKSIASLEKPINYLESFRIFQLLDAMMSDNQYLRNLDLYLDILEKTLKFYREVINERNSHL